MPVYTSIFTFMGPVCQANSLSCLISISGGLLARAVAPQLSQRTVLYWDFSSLNCISPSLCYLLLVTRSLLARAAAPVSSAAFPLGGASIIIAENLDAFGVFECPHRYCARKCLILFLVDLS